MSNFTETMENGLYSLQLPSNSESVAVLENFVDEMVVNLHIGDDVYANLMTCLNQSLSYNIA